MEAFGTVVYVWLHYETLVGNCVEDCVAAPPSASSAITPQQLRLYFEAAALDTGKRGARLRHADGTPRWRVFAPQWQRLLFDTPHLREAALSLLSQPLARLQASAFGRQPGLGAELSEAPPPIKAPSSLPPTPVALPPTPVALPFRPVALPFRPVALLPTPVALPPTSIAQPPSAGPHITKPSATRVLAVSPACSPQSPSRNLLSPISRTEAARALGVWRLRRRRQDEDRHIARVDHTTRHLAHAIVRWSHNAKALALRNTVHAFNGHVRQERKAAVALRMALHAWHYAARVATLEQVRGARLALAFEYSRRAARVAAIEWWRQAAGIGTIASGTAALLSDHSTEVKQLAIPHDISDERVDEPSPSSADPLLTPLLQWWSQRSMSVILSPIPPAPPRPEECLRLDCPRNDTPNGKAPDALLSALSSWQLGSGTSAWDRGLDAAPPTTASSSSSRTRPNAEDMAAIIADARTHAEQVAHTLDDLVERHGHMLRGSSLVVPPADPQSTDTRSSSMEQRAAKVISDEQRVEWFEMHTSLQHMQKAQAIAVALMALAAEEAAAPVHHTAVNATVSMGSAAGQSACCSPNDMRPALR